MRFKCIGGVVIVNDELPEEVWTSICSVDEFLDVLKKYNFARNLMRKIEIEDAANGYNL